MDATLTILYLFCGGLNLILGFSVLIQNYKSATNKSFFFFTLTQALWITSLYFGYLYIDIYDFEKSFIFVRAAYSFSLLLALSFSAFFYYFPRKTFIIPKLAKLIILSVTGLIVIITAFTPLIHKAQIIENGEYISDAFGPLYFVYLLYLVIQIIFVGIIVVSKIKHLHGIERKKIILVTLGMGAFGVSALMVNVILPVFDIRIFYRKAIIFSLFFLIPAFYSLQKHRFFNISYISLNILKKIILLSVFILTVIVSHQIILFLFPNFDLVINLIISSGLGLLAWMGTRKILPKLVTGSFRKLQHAIKELKPKIYQCETYKNLQNILEEYFIIQLNISAVKVFAVRKEKAKIDTDIYLKNYFTDELYKYKRDVLVYDEIKYKKIPKKKKDMLNKSMKKLEACLCFPLFTDHNMIGFFILGHKENHGYYSKEEIAEILKIKQNLEVCLMNILLKLNLQEENDLMKKIIDKKTKSLKKQFQEIKNLLEQQSDFLAITAHEFRTPLSIAMFQLEETLYSHNHKPEVLKDMEVMESSLKNLRELTQKLFDVQQYDFNKVKLHKGKVKIINFLEKIYKEFKSAMKEKSINFSFKCDLKKDMDIEIDPSQIRQVIHNLLNNAIKFCDKKNGNIELQLDKDKKNIYIKVIDNGKGIPDEHKERIFEKFQATKATMGMGIGLGLYICKKIIELHKGKIWAEDTKNGGATICIKLRK